MAAPMNIVGVFRGHSKKFLRIQIIIRQSFCTEADEHEYEKKLAKIRDCSGLPDRLKRKVHGGSPDLSFAPTFKGDKRNRLRKMYAEYGAASGINPGIMYPSKAELEDLLEIEEDWTPTFQQMKQAIENEKAAEAEIARLRDEKVEKAMGKMDELIQQYNKKQKKLEEDIRLAEENTTLLLQEFRDRYGFSVSASSIKFRMFKNAKADEIKEEKKQKKRQSKKDASMQNLQALLNEQKS
ncbi:hypothetical protein ACF0H5_004796 [Mactra antiquata]